MNDTGVSEEVDGRRGESITVKVERATSLVLNFSEKKGEKERIGVQVRKMFKVVKISLNIGEGR